MAMSKAERAGLDSALAALAMARSMRWPEYDAPQPMTQAEIEIEIKAGRVKEFDASYQGGKLLAVVGWDYNEHRGASYEVATTGNSHGEIYQGHVSWQQDRGRIYRYHAEALRAMRIAITERYAKTLANIDFLIKEAEANG